MKTRTTEERIAELEQWADRAMSHAETTTARGPESRLAWAMLANALETRALRLMLRDEIREAAWRLAPAGTVTREGYLADSPFEMPPAPAGIPYGKDSEEAQAIERVIAEADAERKASDE